MFSIEPKPTFEVYVSGFVPGAPAEGLFVAFNYKDEDAAQAWLESLAQRTVIDALMDLIAGWRDAPFDFSRSAVEQTVKKYPAFAPALVLAFKAEMFEAKRKN